MTTNHLDPKIPPPLPGARPPLPAVWMHALIGAAVVGGVSFAVGFFGPMFWLKHNSPQGPMLGIFVTGPAGFLVGLLGGAIVGLVRRRGPGGSS